MIVFQLTTSRGGRPQQMMQAEIDLSISTHDLTRRSTLCGRGCFKSDYISTHDLTRRSTGDVSDADQRINISTHDLTRRSTVWTFIGYRLKIYFNSRPHEEVDLLTTPIGKL